MGRGRRTLNRKPSRAAAFGCDREKKAGQYSESGIDWEEYERSQNLNKNISPNVMTMRYDLNQSDCHDIKDMITNLEQVKRRDPNASAIQAFFTAEEKQQLKQYCDSMGWDASHFIRIIALAYLTGQQNKSA